MHIVLKFNSNNCSCNSWNLQFKYKYKEMNVLSHTETFKLTVNKQENLKSYLNKNLDISILIIQCNSII